MIRKKGAQSTLEYIVVLTAIIAAVVLFLTTFKPGSGQSGLDKLLKKSGQAISRSGFQVEGMVR
jgi:hypothetical protein